MAPNLPRPLKTRLNKHARERDITTESLFLLFLWVFFKGQSNGIQKESKENLSHDLCSGFEKFSTLQ